MYTHTHTHTHIHACTLLITYIYIYEHTHSYIYAGRVAHRVWRLTTGWTVRDRIPVGTSMLARPDRPWDPSSLL